MRLTSPSRRAMAAVLLVLSVAGGCGPSMYTRVDRQLAALPPSCCPLLFGKDDPAPVGALLVGETRYGDTGFTVDCDQQMTMEKVRRDACRIGADAVKVTRQNMPNFWTSTCYRVRADLYRMDAGPESAPGDAGAAAAHGAAICDDAAARRLRPL